MQLETSVLTVPKSYFRFDLPRLKKTGSLQQKKKKKKNLYVACLRQQHHHLHSPRFRTASVSTAIPSRPKQQGIRFASHPSPFLRSEITPLRNGTPLYRYVIKRQQERRVTVNAPSSIATVAMVLVFCLRCGEVMTSHFKVELTIPDGKTLLCLPLEGCVAPPLNLTGNEDTPTFTLQPSHHETSSTSNW